jgi:hypothetical protein
MTGKSRLYIILLLANGFVATAQNYHAVQGSNYAGSLGVGNNPASIVNTPYPWDVTVFGVQEKHSTNAVTLYKYSLLSSPAKSEYLFTGGNFSRYVRENFNINLLNARISLNRQTAVAFGMNIRGYTNLRTSSYNFIDSLHSTRDFFNLGNNNTDLGVNMTSSSWIELYGTYSRTLWDRPGDRLNAGATLKVSRGISGAHAAASDVRALSAVHDNQQYYEFASAEARYGYSQNFDKWKKDNSTSQNISDFLSYTSGGISMDLGLEYILKPGGMLAWDDDDTYYDYDWKIGVSLLDLGFNQYKYGVNSRILSGVRPDISDSLFDMKMNGAENFAAFNDSIADIVNTSSRLQGNFNIINPARMVINVDHYLFDAFYINGDLTINLSSIARNRLRVSDMNLLTITPRWETRRLGVYFPMMVNAEGRFWVGGAFKVGPLLLGIHNWANVFSKTKMQQGGGYLALVIRPGKNTGNGRGDKRYDCPR